MSTNIKALPTRYSGIVFRSRAEARWAVFLDELGIPWEYEVEGYDLGKHGRYLPDFWLPTINTWFEVKGAAPTDIEMAKLVALEEATGHRGIFASGGLPAPWDSGTEQQPGNAWYGSGTFQIETTSDGPYAWCQCPACGKYGIEFDGRGARICGYGTHDDLWNVERAYKTWHREVEHYDPDGQFGHMGGILLREGPPPPAPTDPLEKQRIGYPDKLYSPGLEEIRTAYAKARSERFGT